MRFFNTFMHKITSSDSVIMFCGFNLSLPGKHKMNYIFLSEYERKQGSSTKKAIELCESL
ncbi:MAG: hypothetical protein CMR00_12530 [[Chlorobium] sp. 445]|nr:MAG: hypothetical protein CMR00_12530 [[Chlorobium] sp. 445]